MNVRALFLTLSFILTAFSDASLAANKKKKKRRYRSKAKQEKTFTKKLVNTRDVIANNVLGVTQTVDQFFSSERSELESNKSYIKWTTKSVFEQFEKTDVDLKLSGRVSLPNTEEKLQLIIESDEDGFDDSDQSNISKPNDATDENATSAGLRYFFNNDKSFNWTLDGGLRIQNGIKPFVKTRLRKSIFQKRWEYRFVETIEWLEDFGFSTKTEFYIDRPFYRKFLFRVYNNLKWVDETDVTTWFHNYNVIHKINKRQGLAYQIGVQGLNRPEWFAETYYANVSFRTLLYKDWFFMTLRPGMVWRKEDSFRPRRQLMILFDVFFGNS